jgi:hypothetical protein
MAPACSGHLKFNISFDSFYRAVEKLCKSAVLNRDAEIQEVIWYNAKSGRALKSPDLMNEVARMYEVHDRAVLIVIDGMK